MAAAARARTNLLSHEAVTERLLSHARAYAGRYRKQQSNTATPRQNNKGKYLGEMLGPCLQRVRMFNDKEIDRADLVIRSGRNDSIFGTSTN
jgi:hypothetical protein